MTITTYTDREIALRQQLAAATQLAQLNGEIAAELKADKLALEAAIEAGRKQEPVAYKGKNYGNLHHHDFGNSIPLFAAPVVAPDVLKDAARYRWLREGNFTGQWLLKEVYGGWTTGMDAAIDAAMGGAND